jgi:cytochrome c peroxidase
MFMRLPTDLKKHASGGLASVLLTLVAAVAAATDSPAQNWWEPNSGKTLAASIAYANGSGALAILNTAGAMPTEGHAFFSSLGGNGRACVTCHQPADGMSVSIDTIEARWRTTAGADPLFAAIDGSNCPTLPQKDPASHSLLLNHGLFRIFRAWPPRDPDGGIITPQFSVEVVRDPTGCNLDPVYGLKSAQPRISVFRRPRPVANLKYALSYGFVFEPKNGLPLPLDPHTGLRYSGNLMADQRDRTLEEQAADALSNHLERSSPASAEQLQQIVAFESQVYAAQSISVVGGLLNEGGAEGGPATLAAAKPGVLKSSLHPQWSEFQAWSNAAQDPSLSPEQRAFRLSVARGVDLFRDRTFLITDSAGLNSMNFGNPTRDSCNFCHNMTRTGMDVAPGQVDLGTTNEPFADPAPELPLFKLTCDPKYAAHPFLGRVVYTHDPGFALTTGKCVDIGKITMQSMRGIAARPPYFSNGSARSLREVIDFYDRRYNIGFSEQDKQDLTNLMSVL